MKYGAITRTANQTAGEIRLFCAQKKPDKVRGFLSGFCI
ncbi:trigger factor [Shigella flexneri]|uniref:Trigger factor n=1 Tax=Shigella flexneri TaxID=623 RepID=A0A3T2URM6_SHIFL|nr:trigger factor [Shigella flexneri]EAA1457189.1 trigger factor [Shigella flexneri]EAA2182133.1 trigger factor [Shigella flexneri]EAA2602479.1 trigger factor [Shigella flexneri]EAA3111668.1 trigger factor [Shigella flexneri]